MDLPTTRRNLRQRLAVHRVDGCMPVPTATLTALLDALDAAEAAVQRVRELHQPCDNDRDRTPICEHCHGKAGIHPCGCWAPTDRQPVCAVCNEGDKGIRVEWPCPTERALDMEVTL